VKDKGEEEKRLMPKACLWQRGKGQKVKRGKDKKVKRIITAISLSNLQ